MLCISCGEWQGPVLLSRECFTLWSALGVCFILLSTITQGDHYDLIKPTPDSKDRGLWENHTFLICSILTAPKNNTETVNLKDRRMGFFRLDFDGPLHTVEGRKWKTNPQNPLCPVACIMKTLQQLLVSIVFLIALKMAHNHLLCKSCSLMPDVLNNVKFSFS